MFLYTNKQKLRSTIFLSSPECSSEVVWSGEKLTLDVYNDLYNITLHTSDPFVAKRTHIF